MTDPQDNDAAAELERVFDRYADVIFRYLCLHIGDRDISKDLTQETFIRFWQCLERKEEIRHERALLYRIANNLLIDHTRRKKTVSLDDLLEQGFEPTDRNDPMKETHGHLELKRVLTHLHKLPEVYRDCLILRYVECLEPSEIATVTGETSNVISVRIHRGLKQLKSLLSNHA